MASSFTPNEYAGVESDEQRFEEVQQLRKWFSRADKVSFPAESFIRHFNSIDSSFSDKIVFLPFLLHTSSPESAEDVMQKFDSQQPLRLLFVSRDGELKGIYELQQALTMLVQERPSIATKMTLTVVSETECPPVPGMNILQYHSLPRHDVLRLMRDAHVLCHPTKKDSYGFVVIEAMANGCAIVADNREPRSEILDYGRCGILTDRSVESIALALATLVDDRAYAMNLALRAWQRYHTVYSHSRCLDLYAEQLSQLVHA